MPALLDHIDPDGLLEYSVVYTDRSLNHMSARFQQVMRDLDEGLCEVYGADQAVLLPGGGTFAMEAVARQFARDKPCMVIRNGWFSYRWSQIFERGHIPSSTTVLTAQPLHEGPASPFVPRKIDEVVDTIRAQRPAMVFAPHVETSAGVLLPDAYLAAVADAAHEVGALFVLDCVASGCLWVDMRKLGVDVVVTAPQKGWSGSPGAGVVMFGERALASLEHSTSDSFACDLKQWQAIMNAYRAGAHAYHATLPTDALVVFRDVMQQMRDRGFDQLAQRQRDLGQTMRTLLGKAGFVSVAAPGYEAPTVVVSYTDDDALKTGRAFAEQGVQIAAGVPLEVGEPEGFMTFRIGLFGLDKLDDVAGTVERFRPSLQAITRSSRVSVPA